MHADTPWKHWIKIRSEFPNKTIWDQKCLQKCPWVCFVIYCWARGPSSYVVNIPNETLLEETRFSFASVVNYRELLGSAWELMTASPSQFWDPLWLEPSHPATVSVSSHVRQPCWVWKTLLSESPRPLRLLQCFCLFFCIAPWGE